MDLRLLEQRLQALQDDHRLTLRRIDALDGAIQECEYWIRAVSAAAASTSTPKALVTSVDVETNE